MPESRLVEERRFGPRLPTWLERKKKWLADHHMTLVTMADTPHSIALGSAVGIFFGFTPLYSLKTLLALGFAWICRSNKLAAAIASNQEWRETRPAQFSCAESEIVAKVREVLARHDVKWG